MILKHALPYMVAGAKIQDALGNVYEPAYLNTSLAQEDCNILNGLVRFTKGDRVKILPGNPWIPPADDSTGMLATIKEEIIQVIPHLSAEVDYLVQIDDDRTVFFPSERLEPVEE